MKFALRSLLRTPGFTIVAVLTLAIGIGANTAIFSTINAALLRPLPYPHADRLVELRERRADGGINNVSGGAFLDWRTHQTLFDRLTLLNGVAFNFRDQGAPPVRLDGLAVTHEFLRVLDVPPLLGRDFLPEDEQPGGQNHVVILTEELWRSRFGADPSVLGTQLILDDMPHTVVGVAPAGAWLHRDAQFFVPIVLRPNTELSSRDLHFATVIGRMKSGVTPLQAETELKEIKRQLESDYPTWKREWSVNVFGLQTQLSGNSRPALLTLIGAVGLVLLIACANVANLLLARASDRRQEIAVRAALGASGARLMRQVLAESLLLAFLGGGLGVVLSFWGVDALRHFTADVLPRALAPTIDGRVLAFSIAVTGATGLLFGIVPAWQVRRPNLNDVLKSGGRSATTGGRNRTQSALVIAEVALTLMLLASAGLLLRSLAKVTGNDTGFEPHRAVAFDLSLPGATYGNNEQRLAFLRDALARLRAIPGVDAAGAGLGVPFSGRGPGEYISRPDQPDNQSLGRLDYISGGYLEALGAKLLAGRTLTDADNTANAPRQVVINQMCAQMFFANEDPVGHSIFVLGNSWRIVGVIADIPDRSLDGAPRPFAYAALAFESRRFSLVVRTTSSLENAEALEPLSLVPSLRAAIQRIDPGLPLANIRTLEQAMSGSLAQRRVILSLIGAFAITALALACIGLYGVMAYSVVIRRRELSIRLALGATPAAIARMVLRDGFRLTLVGLAVGLAGAFAGARLIASFLFGVGPHDPFVLGAAACLLAAVAVASCWLPASRAARVEPMTALRSD
jgi:predicted permease